MVNLTKQHVRFSEKGILTLIIRVPKAVTPPFVTYTAAPMAAKSHILKSQNASRTWYHFTRRLSAPYRFPFMRATRISLSSWLNSRCAVAGVSGRTARTTSDHKIVILPAARYLSYKCKLTRLTIMKTHSHILPRSEGTVSMAYSKVDCTTKDREDACRRVPDPEPKRELCLCIPHRTH